MNIKIVVIGKIKENALKELIFEYLKQLKNYATIEIIELEDESTKQNKDLVLKLESNRLNKYLDDNFFKVLLAIKGKEYTSVQFSELLQEVASFHQGKILFVIGGSYGVDSALSTKFDLKLSFSHMTFPHQLFRLLLIEQIYRGFKIWKNEPYHK